MGSHQPAGRVCERGRFGRWRQLRGSAVGGSGSGNEPWRIARARLDLNLRAILIVQVLGGGFRVGLFSWEI